MTRDLITVQQSERLGAVIQILHDNDIRHLPVLDGDRLVGLISDRDLRNYRPPAEFVEENVVASVQMLDTPAHRVMNPNVITVRPTDTIDRAIDLFVDLRIGAVCVVDDHALVGIVSYIDVLRALRHARQAT